MNNNTRGSRGSKVKVAKNNNFFNKKILIIGAIALVGIITLLLVFRSNKTVMSMHEYKHINYENINIVLEDKVLTELTHFPIIKDGQIYLPVNFIENYVDQHIYWEPHINLLTITTPLKLMRIEPGNYQYALNLRDAQLTSLIHNIDNIAYIPLDLIHEIYDINVYYDQYLNMLIIDYTHTEKIFGEVKSNTSMVRHEPNRKSPIVETIYLGDTLRIFDIQEIYTIYEEEKIDIINLEDVGYTKVRTSSGNIGYVRTRDIEETVREQGYTRQPEIPASKSSEIDGRINMTWDLLTNQTANTMPRTRVPHTGVNVLSPTWLSFDRETYNGDVISVASKQYVEWAHSQGYQVWPLVFDYEDADVTGIIMADTAKRDHVIRQFIDLAEYYNFDGINIDFERIRVEEINYFLQFLRELSPVMRERGLVLSVAVFVPAPWTMFFNRTEIARVADYVIIMAYDETTSGHPSGPNASIGFVHRAVVQTLEEVPSHQIILGVPFYTRIWREVEVDGEIQNSVRSVGMQFAYNFFVEGGAEFIWKEEYGSYYASFTTVENDEVVTYRAWIEDERSIERKMQLVGDYDLAGVASWSRGLETPNTWYVIYENLNR